MATATQDPDLKPKQLTEEESRQVAEDAREATWEAPSFLKEVFAGNFKFIHSNFKAKEGSGIDIFFRVDENLFCCYLSISKKKTRCMYRLCGSAADFQVQ